MKYDQYKNDMISSMVEKWWSEDSSYSQEYNDTYKNMEIRDQIHRITLASTKIGLFFEPEVSFTLWSFWSSEMACSGWLNIGQCDLPKIIITILDILEKRGYIVISQA